MKPDAARSSARPSSSFGTATIGVAGATGLVGQAMLQVLSERSVDPANVRALASERSAGVRLTMGKSTIPVSPLTEDALADLDLLLVALGDDLARTWVERARARGISVVDNSAAYRLDPDVPLVIPEVNGHLLDHRPRVIANPNCSTITMIVPLASLAARGDLRHVHAATYQSASGAGTDAIRALHDRSRDGLDGKPLGDLDMAFNCLPAIGRLDEDGHCREERKMVRESRRILDLPDLALTCTTVRVPTEISHGVAVHAVFDSPMSVEEAAARLGAGTGVRMGVRNDLPTPRAVAGRDDVTVGRLRSGGDDRVIAFWAVADNVRKGAATNTVQIAERLMGS
jgi:aspartate-semialdehyde dehydrogenase